MQSYYSRKSCCGLDRIFKKFAFVFNLIYVYAQIISESGEYNDSKRNRNKPILEENNANSNNLNILDHYAEKNKIDFNFSPKKAQNVLNFIKKKY